jgi:hypothetical protein
MVREIKTLTVRLNPFHDAIRRLHADSEKRNTGMGPGSFPAAETTSRG